MLAGEPPHTGPTVQAVIAQALDRAPTRIRTVRDTVPEGIDSAGGEGVGEGAGGSVRGRGGIRGRLRCGGPGRSPVGGAAAWRRGQHRGWRSPSQGSPRCGTPGSVLRGKCPNGDARRGGAPFDNLTGNPSDRYLSDGMTEEVIGQLARVRASRSISRTSAEAAEGDSPDLRQIADTLGVRHVVEGSVRHAGNVSGWRLI